ncbi:MAG: hypothetical protein AMXMBFR36_27860 [Acidobacteriota bacterium]
MTTPLLMLCHPAYGVPERAEPIDGEGGERVYFTSENGEAFHVDRIRGRWGEPTFATMPADSEPAPFTSEPPAPTPTPRRASNPGDKAAKRLLNLFDSKQGQIIRDPAGKRYAVVNTGRHWETLDADGLRGYFASASAARGDLPGDSAIREAVFAALSREARPEHVYLRVGSTDAGRRLVLDLADEARRVVEIDSEGWRVRDRSPVLFRRPGSLRPLPDPVDGGNLDELSDLFGLEGEAKILALSWLLGTLAPAGPFPMLVFLGPQGSGKTTAARALKRLIDDTAAPLRALPRDERELAVSAQHSYLIGLDNLSGISGPISDALCRLAGGDGFATRKLYSDDAETVLEAARPVIATTIGELALARADLADRALVIQLEPRRRFVPDDELEAAFATARPRLLGALLTAASVALRNLGTTSRNGLPRMASFARWVLAAESAMPWAAGDFMATYAGNRETVAISGVEGDALAQAVLELVAIDGGRLETTAGELLSRLETRESLRRSSDLPKNPRALGDRLRRLVPGLRAVGYVATIRREGHDRERRWVIRRATGADE